MANVSAVYISFFGETISRTKYCDQDRSLGVSYLAGAKLYTSIRDGTSLIILPSMKVVTWRSLGDRNYHAEMYLNKRAVSSKTRQVMKKRRNVDAISLFFLKPMPSSR